MQKHRNTSWCPNNETFFCSLFTVSGLLLQSCSILFQQTKKQTFLNKPLFIHWPIKIIFNVLMLLQFLVNTYSYPLPLLFPTDNELDFYEIQKVNKKQPWDNACIYFVFNGAWWQGLKKPLQAPVMLFKHDFFSFANYLLFFQKLCLI